MSEPVVTPVEAVQADLLGWLVGRRYLTYEGLNAVRGHLVHDPAHQSPYSRRVLVEVIKQLARARGVPPSDDPAWPPSGDPVWDVPSPEIPDYPPGA